MNQYRNRQEMESTEDSLDLRHGPGLILVRQIVDAHNETMQIESEKQKGYKVILDFPLAGGI